MSAESGRRRPAIKSRSDVLPAPDGPNTAVTWLSNAMSISRTNSASGSRIFFSTSFMLTLRRAAHQAFAGPDSEEGECDRYAEQPERVAVVAELNGLKDGERQRRGP